MSRGVLYLLTAKKDKVPFGVALAVSLWTMRSSGAWKGPVHIACGDELAYRIAYKLCEDERLGCTACLFAHETRRNGHYSAKARMVEFTPFDDTLFVDADTTFTGGDISPLWPQQRNEVVITQWCDWVSTGRKLNGRISAWQDVCGDLCDRQLKHVWPAINTGVLAFGRKASILPDWKALCDRQEEVQGRVRFMQDELAMQLLYPDYDHRLLDGRFNSSSKFGPHEDVRIRHFHGKKHARHEPSKLMWMPLFSDALESNAGGLRDWSPHQDPAVWQHFEKWRTT